VTHKLNRAGNITIKWGKADTYHFSEIQCPAARSDIKAILHYEEKNDSNT